ncbi:MAG TPA: methyltransferase domain-containing protein [Acidimicrobiales bacterium]|nr:methyltransferase domain-containing protein [Acidimicrobiales bacterium]
MSHFSDVDASPAIDSLKQYLERTDHFMAPLKAYMTAAAAAAVGHGGVVVDIGCGLGRDLARLHASGLRPIGVDRSAALLAVASSVGAPVVQADAASLPFRDGSVDGVRIERVLEHVIDPERVLDEAARVLRPGGWVAVLEPDFGTFRVESDVVTDGSWPAALLAARHPYVGGVVADMLSERGFAVRDIVTESSRGRAFEFLPVDAAAVVARAVGSGRCDAHAAAEWIAEQRRRSLAGTLRARWDKVLVVASLVD